MPILCSDCRASRRLKKSKAQHVVPVARLTRPHRTVPTQSVSCHRGAPPRPNLSPPSRETTLSPATPPATSLTKPAHKDYSNTHLIKSYPETLPILPASHNSIHPSPSSLPTPSPYYPYLSARSAPHLPSSPVPSCEQMPCPIPNYFHPSHPFRSKPLHQHSRCQLIKPTPKESTDTPTLAKLAL